MGTGSFCFSGEYFSTAQFAVIQPIALKNPQTIMYGISASIS